jgi:hypothetical protein
MKRVDVLRVTPQILNNAMSAYVQTFPTRDKLTEYITNCGLIDQEPEIVEKLDAVLRTAEDHLWSFSDGVPWTQAFESDYKELLLQRHPWLITETLDRILGFSRWLCWHEGLNALEI